MSLIVAAECLEELSQGQIPDQLRLVQGIEALDVLLLRGKCAQEIHDAAAKLELIVATDGAMSPAEYSRARASALATAVRQAIAHG